MVSSIVLCAKTSSEDFPEVEGQVLKLEGKILYKVEVPTTNKDDFIFFVP